MNGEDCKRWRALFKPGFSVVHMVKIIPCIVQFAEVFRGILREETEQGILQLYSLTIRSTTKVIAEVTLDVT
jgi:hypothetical protein